MKAKRFLYAGIILFPFFFSKAKAQNRERHRSVTINQTVVDGKVVASDTIITYTDTTTRTINSKEVSMDMPYTKGGTVYIDNSYRKLNIRQSKDGKVRLVTTAFFYGEPSFTNEQWLEKLNIQMKNTDTGLVITSAGINQGSNSTGNTWGQNGYYYSYQTPAAPEPPVAQPPVAEASGNSTRSLSITRNGAASEVVINGFGSVNGTRTVWGNASTGRNTAVFDEKGNNVYNSSSLRREITLYIPIDAKLNVISKYADVDADHDLKNLKIKINNGSLDMVNADNATIMSTYSNVSCGNIGNGEIWVTSGKLSMKDAGQLTLNTKYSKVEIDNCNSLTLKSTSDDYDLDAVKYLTGTKNYGNLRIDKLAGSFDLKGSSADVKIRNIDPSVSFITLDNKYSDIRFPVAGLKNYEVVFSGNYSSVFAPFERRDTTMEKKPASTIEKPATSTNTGSGFAPFAGTTRRNDNSFWAAVGDTKGTHTKFNLTCTSCNVDFK